MREPQIIDPLIPESLEVEDPSLVPQESAQCCSPVPINSIPILSELCQVWRDNRRSGCQPPTWEVGTEQWELDSGRRGSMGAEGCGVDGEVVAEIKRREARGRPPRGCGMVRGIGRQLYRLELG